MIPRIAVAKSECAITRVGFGCARLQGGSELRASRRLIEAALECGIRHFDTAPGYGASETVLGEVLSGVRDVTIATKVGIRRPTHSTPTRTARVYRSYLRPGLSHFPRMKSGLLRLAGRVRLQRTDDAPPLAKRRLCRDEILRELEDSLRHLKRAQLDLYLLHEPDQFEIDAELAEVFGDLQLSNTIRAFGLAFDRVADFGTGFGSVAQGRLPLNAPVDGSPDETRIFHGVLRHGWSKQSEATGGPTPGAWLSGVLRDHPDAAVIFSASEPHQIRRLTSQYESACSSARAEHSGN